MFMFMGYHYENRSFFVRWVLYYGQVLPIFFERTFLSTEEGQVGGNTFVGKWLIKSQYTYIYKDSIG